MELVLEILNPTQFVAEQLCRKSFKQGGGVIGRGDDCDWIIADPKRHLSSRHALVSYRNGGFYLTDTSSNGVVRGDIGARLRRGEAVRIEQGSLYVLGGFEIRALLIHPDPAMLDVDVGRSQAAGSIIPDDAFLDLDPLNALDDQERVCSEIEELISPRTVRHHSGPCAEYARIDMESLMIPELSEVPAHAEPVKSPAFEQQVDVFWERFGTALGVDFKGLDHRAKETLALNAAGLLKQSIGGLLQNLRTRSELKNELRLTKTLVQSSRKNPLKFATDTSEALEILLKPNKPGHLPSWQAISWAFSDLQAHQVALLCASRAAVRATLEHFSPQQLTLRFERDNKRLLTTSGSRWRAFGRYHHALKQDNDWSERLLTRDFAQAYEEQLRLIFTLHADHQG
jgi:type VI secretion system protein ImpI